MIFYLSCETIFHVNFTLDISAYCPSLPMCINCHDKKQQTTQIFNYNSHSCLDGKISSKLTYFTVVSPGPNLGKNNVNKYIKGQTFTSYLNSPKVTTRQEKKSCLV